MTIKGSAVNLIATLLAVDSSAVIGGVTMTPNHVGFGSIVQGNSKILSVAIANNSAYDKVINANFNIPNLTITSNCALVCQEKAVDEIINQLDLF